MNTTIEKMSTIKPNKTAVNRLSSEKVSKRTPSVEDKTLKESLKKPHTYPSVSSTKLKKDIDEDIEFLMKQAQDNRMGINMNPKTKKKKCLHESIINEGGIDICVNCGETIQLETFDTEWRYYGDNDSSKSYDPSRCQYRKVQDKGIKIDLEKLGFSREIIDKADYYYQKVTKEDIKRSKIRKGIMFACVLYSYKFIKKHITTEELDDIFKIGRRNMSKGLTYFKTRIPKDELINLDSEYITAEHYIPSILEKFNVKQEHVKYVLSLYKQLNDKSILINTSNPQSVSSGLVYYFLKKLNIDITPSKFGKMVSLSEITISRISNEIEDILVND
jgi:transcription initiation factor TFIIIB Brf1 subunit/transcription initiation factor TFIIB